VAEQLVPTEHTKPALSALYACLRSEWRAQLATEPARASLLVLMAQWGHETALGSACLNWNLAGIKHTPGDGHDFAVYQTWEVLNGKHVVLDQQFRAYQSLSEGVHDYLTLLRTRFGYAWPAVEAGDVADFARRLRARGYYTDLVDSYTRGLQARYSAIDSFLGEDTVPDLSVAAMEPVRPVHLADSEPPTPPEDLPPVAA